MKKYIVTIYLDDYCNDYQTFEGESIDDPKMKQEIVKWMSELNEGAWDFTDWFEPCGSRESVSNRYGAKIYEIAEGPMLIPNIWIDLEKYLDEEHAKWKKQAEEQNAKKRREQYEQLKKEFGS